MIQGHGDDLYRYGDKVKHNFSSNVAQVFDHSGLLKYLGETGWMIDRYPEPVPYTLEEKTAAWTGVGPENVMVTNGATDAIYTIAREASAKSSAIVSPTFSEYYDACAAAGHDVRFVGSLAEASGTEHLTWLCNPNNPTGRVTPAKEILAFARSHPRTILVLDQAYSDYTLLPVVTPRQAVEAGNILLLGSFTKRFAIPGLRVGYVIGNPALINKLKERRMPWAVSGPAIAAAECLVDHRDEFVIPARMLHDEALRISREIAETGITVGPTDCNFILCRLPRGSAAELKEWLVSRHGILIRNADNFHGLTPAHFRVAAQRPEQNNLLINALKEWTTL